MWSTLTVSTWCLEGPVQPGTDLGSKFLENKFSQGQMEQIGHTPQVNKVTPGRWPRCESCGKARASGQMGQKVWGTLQEGRSKGSAFGPPNRLVQRPLCSREQPGHCRATGLPLEMRSSTKAPGTLPQDTRSLPHHATSLHHALPWLLPPQRFPSGVRKLPTLVCRGQGTTGYSTQRMPRTMTASLDGPRVGTPSSYPTGIYRVLQCFQGGTKYSIYERINPYHPNTYTHACSCTYMHTHMHNTHTRRAVKADEARVGETPVSAELAQVSRTPCPFSKRDSRP